VSSKVTEMQAPHNSQSSFCFTLIHVQLLQLSCARTNKTHVAYLSSWHKNIFDYELRTD